MESTRRLAIEALIKLATDNPLEGVGRAEEAQKSPEDFDPTQLALGIDVEKEHTNDPAVAAEVAMDHLTEIPDYYTRLNEMEDAATVGEEGEGEASEKVSHVVICRALTKLAAEMGVAEDEEEEVEEAEEEDVDADTDEDEDDDYDGEESSDAFANAVSKVAAAMLGHNAHVFGEKKEAFAIADRVLRKLSADSVGGSSASTGIAASNAIGGNTTPSMGGMPPAPGQMGAAQPKRLEPMQKQN
jgi:hypothetical protein